MLKWRVVPVLLMIIVATAPALLGQSSEITDPPTPADRYVALSAANDHDGLIALWREHGESAIPVIDSDLEGSLALWEEHRSANADRIDLLLARAIAGAVAATEATGRRRILDYVTSFAGWDDAQKVEFRAGQAAYRAGSQALRDGDPETALARGRECHGLAEPLGDWWGTAMGLGLEGSALAAMGDEEGAATALARARLVYRELGLTGSALRIEAELAGILLDLGRGPRAEAMIADGLATSRRLGLEPLVARFEELGTRVNRTTRGMPEPRPTDSSARACPPQGTVRNCPGPEPRAQDVPTQRLTHS